MSSCLQNLCFLNFDLEEGCSPVPHHSPTVCVPDRCNGSQVFICILLREGEGSEKYCLLLYDLNAL